MNTHNIIIKPIISEKSMREAGAGKFAFAVHRFADKTAISSAIASLFNVNVTGIVTSVIKGKRKRTGKQRREVHDNVWKRAIVTLKTGEKIGLFEQGAESDKK